jgi:hypothetical protein
VEIVCGSFSEKTFINFRLTAPSALTNPDCTISNRIAVTVQSATDSYSFDNGINAPDQVMSNQTFSQTYKII